MRKNASDNTASHVRHGSGSSANSFTAHGCKASLADRTATRGPASRIASLILIGFLTGGIGWQPLGSPKEMIESRPESVSGASSHLAFYGPSHECRYRGFLNYCGAANLIRQFLGKFRCDRWHGYTIRYTSRLVKFRALPPFENMRTDGFHLPYSSKSHE